MNQVIETLEKTWPVIAPLITPPKNQMEYELLQARLDDLEERVEEGSELESLLDYMGELLDQYEQANFPEVADLENNNATPAEILKRFMKRNELKQKDLASIFGAQSRVSEVLNGKRPMTAAQIKELHKKYKIPVTLLL